MDNRLQRHPRLLSFIFIILTILQKSAGQDFSYNGPKGPDHWGEQYNKCDGKYQSPINIDEALVTNVVLPPIDFVGFDDYPLSAELLNNGHTAKVTMEFKDDAYITGGPLEGTYQFEQLHFHWGSSNNHGSESQINNRSFSMEIHFVLYKNVYLSMDRALNYRDGVTVLAGFFEVSDIPNPKFDELTSLLSDVVEKGRRALFLSPPKLSDYLPSDLIHYYTYNGSLTTPPCNEAVIWIDFAQPIPISTQQLEQFRRIHDQYGETLTENTRPIQPLNGRRVLYNMEEIEFKVIADNPNGHTHVPIRRGYRG